MAFNFAPFAIGGASRPDTFTGMNPQFLSALSALFQSAPTPVRENLRINSGFRSPERQAQLWQAALAKYGSPAAARKWVAPPGRSKHNLGMAADLKFLSPAARKWVHDNAADFGLNFPLGNEPWHIELASARGGGSPAAVQETATRNANVGAAASPAGILSAIGEPEMANGPRGILDTIAQGNPLLDLGLGILAASGDQPFGPALAQGAQFAQTRGAARMENDIIRERLLQQQRQQRGAQQLQGLLSDPNFDPSSPQALGILSTIAPDAVASGLINQAFPSERSAPADIRTMEELGIPLTPEGFQQFQDMKEGGTSEELDQIRTRLEINKLLDERDTARTEGERARVDSKISIFNSVDRLGEIAEINNRLRGTFAETGLGFSEFRRLAAGPISVLAGVFGGDEARARQVAADVGRFEQLTTSEAIQALFGGQVDAGTLTNDKMNTFLTTKPGLNQLPETNNRIIADMMQSTLDSAEKMGVELPNRGEIEQRIEELRSAPSEESEPAEGAESLSEGAGRAVEGARDAAGEALQGGANLVRRIGRMTQEQLQKLDPKTLSDEALDAAVRRWEELGF